MNVHDQERFAGQAPIEPNVTQEQAWNHEYTYVLKSDEKDISIKRTIASIIEDELEGYGKVDLHSLRIKYVCSKANQAIMCGLGNAVGEKSITQIASRRAGFSHVSNSYNFGIQSEVELIVPDTLTRQIQPASSHLPAMRLYLSTTGGPRVSLILQVKTYGPRIIDRELSLN